MSVSRTLLGLLEPHAQHGYTLCQLDAGFEMFHLDADLKWIDAAQARLDRLADLD